MPGQNPNLQYVGVQHCLRLLHGNYAAYHRDILLGYFNTPEEAAIAHNHAAVLLNGCITPPNAIPPDRMPTQKRQEAITNAVEKCVRRTKEATSLLQPNPRSPKCTSGYLAVFASRPRGKWTAQVTWHGRHVSLGSYDSKHEAAYAYNYTVGLLGDQYAPTNVIPNDFLPPPERRVQIHGLVEHHLQQFGMFESKAASHDRVTRLPGVSKLSGYRGVCLVRKVSRWTAYLVRNQEKIILGHYGNKHEAALAFNHAVLTLRADHIPPNTVPTEQVPTTDHHALIKLFVEQKLWENELIERQPVHGEYAEYALHYATQNGYHGVRYHTPSKLWHADVPYQQKTLALGYFKTEHEGAFGFNHSVQVLGLPGWLNNHIDDGHMPDPMIQQRIQAKVENKLMNRHVGLSPMAVPGPEFLPTAIPREAEKPSDSHDQPSPDGQDEASVDNLETNSPKTDELIPLATAWH